MKCGNCKWCEPMEVCGCDCKCKAKSTDDLIFEVSVEDDINFYGEQNNTPCKDYIPAD